jgi:hypothetical protein
VVTYYPAPRAKPLTLLQANVGRGPVPHEIALSLAYSENIDIILLQEPYVSDDLSRRLSKRHLSYECFAPTDDLTANRRPRVLTYIRKGTGIHATQVRGSAQMLQTQHVSLTFSSSIWPPLRARASSS